jgi:O-antigen/teichoic acid export membrane protein
LTQDSSFRQILRSSSIIGGASVVNILVGMVRVKLLAVLLGPAGVGLAGLLQNVLSTGAAVATLGLGSVGTRDIAEAQGRGDTAGVGAARHALFLASIALAAAGALLVWLLRDWIAAHALGDVKRSADVAWLAAGVALTVLSTAQGALLNGLRRIPDIAWISLLSGLGATVLGVGCILIWGASAIAAFVIAGPFAAFIVGMFFVRRVPRVATPKPPLPELAQRWGVMARLGSSFMVAGMLGMLGQLAVRGILEQRLGLVQLGHFQAAWAISMTYIAFVLEAMGTDYYPRLSAVVSDRVATNRLVNDQTEAALLLSGPVFIAVLAFAPGVIALLYSAEFAGAVGVLRWQILGDILKVASWPLGFILLAAGDGRKFMLTDGFGVGVFVLITWLALPWLGVQAAGVAFLAMYVAYLAAVYWLAVKRTGFRWRPAVARQLALLLGAALLLCAAAAWSEMVATALGLVLLPAFSLHALARLGHMADLQGPLGKAAALSRVCLLKVGLWRE